MGRPGTNQAEAKRRASSVALPSSTSVARLAALPLESALRWSQLVLPALTLVTVSVLHVKHGLDSGPPNFGLVLIGTFVVLPLLLRHLFAERMVLTFPLYVVYIMLGMMVMLSSPAESFSGAPSVSSLTLMIACGALGGVYLFRRSNMQSLLRSCVERQEVRTKVDALVRIRFRENGSDPRGQQGDEDERDLIPLQSNCVVIRDISESGAGVYGFPDDISAISVALSDKDEAILEIIYREESHYLQVDCRWWKGSSGKGECGLEFIPSPAASALHKSLMQDATPANGRNWERLFSDQGATPLFASLTWLYSFLGNLIFIV